jgi:predicted outer membrane repeat protein
MTIKIGGTIDGTISGTSASLIKKEGSGELTISGNNNGVYKGIYEQIAGTTTIQRLSFGGLHKISSSTILFDTNSSFSEGARFELNAGTMTIGISAAGGDLTINGQIEGDVSSVINKTGDVTLNIRGDNRSYRGMFEQSAGKTIVSSASFGGEHKISGGSVLEFYTGASFSDGAKFELDAGTITISANNNLELEGQVKGDAASVIRKTGDAILSIKGDNSLYFGRFEQTAGTTAVNSNFFSGTNKAYGGTIQINDNGQIISAIDMEDESVLNINVTGLFDLKHSSFTGAEYEITKTNLGILNVKEDFGQHSGTFKQSQGNTIITSGTFNSQHIIEAGTLEFATGTALSTYTKVDLGKDALLLISGDDVLSFGDGFMSGDNDSSINKTGTGTLNITGDNSVYGGIFTQSGGTTTVTSNAFNTAHTINGGTLEFATGTGLSADTKVILGAKGRLLISAGDNLTFGEYFLTGEAASQIDKTGEGTLTISGDNSGYAGTYRQESGTTILSSAVFSAAGIYNDARIDLLEESYLGINGQMSGSGELNVSSGSKADFKTAQKSYLGEMNIEDAGEIGITFEFTPNGAYPLFERTIIYVGGDIALVKNISKLSVSVLGQAPTFMREYEISVVYAKNEEKPETFALDEETAKKYYFVWEKARPEFADEFNYIGYLRGSGQNLKWNNFVEVYQETQAEIIMLPVSLTASVGDNNPYLYPAGDIIIDGGGNTLDSHIFDDLGFLFDGSSVTFTNITLKNFRSGAAGGAVYVNESSTINFVGDMEFISNSANESGGAIYNAGEIIFNIDAGEAVKFESNTAKAGGDIYQTAGGITQIKGAGDVIIGGGIAGEGVIIKDGDGILYIEGDSGGYRGIYEQNAGKMIVSSVSLGGTNRINNSEVEFIDGSAFAGGEDYELNAGTITIRADNDLKLNGQISGNGFIKKTAIAVLELSGDNGGYTGKYEQNAGKTKVSGGSFSGLYNISDSELEFADGSSFAEDSNYVLNNAIMTISSDDDLRLSGYIRGDGFINKTGLATFETESNNSGYSGTFRQEAGKTVFRSASFGGVHSIKESELEFADGSSFADDSIYVLDKGLITISADSDLIFNNLLIGNLGSRVEKTGEGVFTFGNAAFDNIAFNASAGEVTFVSGGGFRGEAFEIDGGELNMQTFSAGGLALEEIKANKFSSKTDMKIDIYDTAGGNDKVVATIAQVGGNLNIRAHLGTYDNIEYELITATGGAGSLSGKFATSTINYPEKLTHRIYYRDDIVLLILNGILKSNFSDMTLLSYNQRETARTFDEMSTQPPAGWQDILFIMDEKRERGTQEDIAQVRDFLAQTSGYFLSNVIRSAAANNPRGEVYEKIRDYEGGETKNGLWGQITGGAESFGCEDNSIGTYNDGTIGLTFGYDGYAQEKSLAWGAYARINKESIEQEKNAADGNKNGIGVYGGYIKDKYVIKATVLGSYDIFDTRRAVMGQTAKGEIGALTIIADAEGSFKYGIKEYATLIPYAGIEWEDTNYAGFKESGAGIYNLDVESGNYIRSALRAGSAIEYEKNKVSGYAKAEIKYLLIGATPEIRSEFNATGINFGSRGSQEGSVGIGIGAGGKVKVRENLIVYGSINYYGAERYSNIYGNVGVRYVFD